MTPRTIGAIEAAMAAGFPAWANLNHLLNRLASLALTDAHGVDRFLWIIQEAARRETGPAIQAVLGKDELLPKITGRRRIIDIDQDLKPFYGYITPALEQLQSAGLSQHTADMWLTYFLKDNAIYRVNTTACMCTAGAILKANIETRLTVGGQ